MKLNLYLPLKIFLLLALIIFLPTCQSQVNHGEESNHLIKENSPYLLQHAYNPVDWYPWGEKALVKAQKEDKMMIISIGYSACHWCHVMEHESFEDSLVASIMNEHFVSIKIDREERPDIDDVYMTACHLASGNSCGWPLNAFALPDGRPVWAGTYFPKENWIDLLNQFIKLKDSDKERLERSAAAITQGIEARSTLIKVDGPDNYSLKDIRRQVSELLNNLDKEWGGLEGAPKFPMPSIYQFLLHYHSLTGDQESLDLAALTLNKIGNGGIYDHLGGGFARYSVDEEWLIPHFEKMLYDNGQLISLYANAYRRTQNPLFKEKMTETIRFMDLELRHPDGGFYSSYDADSEGEEGKYYTWTAEELKQVLGSEAELFNAVYEVTSSGNWKEENINVLHRRRGLNEIAQEFELSMEALKSSIQGSKEKLHAHRSSREKPGLDDKVLAGWNGLAVAGLIDAYMSTGEKAHLRKAELAVEFIHKNFIQDDFRILRNFKDGNTKINGFLDDYACVIDALSKMYEATFDIEYLDLAASLTTYAIEHFHETETGMFSYTSNLDLPLVAKKISFTDNVIPSANSMMARNLWKLGSLYNRKGWTTMAKQMIDNVWSEMEASNNLSFFSNWGRLMLEVANPPWEIAIMGPDADALKIELQRNLNQPAYFVGGLEENLPLLENKLPDDGTLIYVCKNKVCKFPVETVEEALKLME